MAMQGKQEEPRNNEMQNPVEKPGPEVQNRRRLYWVDWCRTQSIWNVVCGHIWWTVRDEGFPSISEAITHPEGPQGARMIEYVVDQGMFHTVPLFFIVSGYLTSLTFKATPKGVCRFFMHRIMRIFPAWILGSLFLAFAWHLRGRKITIVKILTSHLWFCWALLAVQGLFVPFSVVVRWLLKYPVSDLCKNGPHAERGICLPPFYAGAHVFLSIMHSVAFQWSLGIYDGYSMWALAAPLTSGVLIILFWFMREFGLRKNNQKFADAFAFCAVLWIIACFYIFAGSIPVCPVKSCSKYDHLTVNIVYSLT